MKQVGIIGAGPAGLSCALWLKNLGFSPLVIERSHEACETIAQHHHANNWLLGFGAIPGAELRLKMLHHVQSNQIGILYGTTLSPLYREASGKISVHLQNQPFVFDDLVIATGSHPRCPPELTLLSRTNPESMQIGPGSPAYRQLSGKKIMILGGGDNALEHALWLAQQNNHVDVLMRSTPRARADFIESASTHPHIHLMTHQDITHIDTTPKGVHLISNGHERFADYLMVMYGFEPNTGWIPSVMPWGEHILDEQGFIKVDSKLRTPVSRIYAAGDVANTPYPCIPVAIAQGSIAAKSIALDDHS